ncbi:hypothetical protein RJZ56_006849 [Blastomyces dermatitidis]|uniref:Chromo domain-containing protein n=1 Tax=Ajellomyces dermatitidis (strain ATCC 18188 / CBS 674.68) TaxID=653446 RepID=F2TTN9_AJEDA|nr:hypothetical protein BDDG_09548 [Blastomyces dermatitidis ATCC 18188]EQL28896.1 hypothetical protein BDFG_08417 [Blastomyces dermatitidis ATCC 26199]
MPTPGTGFFPALKTDQHHDEGAPPSEDITRSQTRLGPASDFHNLSSLGDLQYRRGARRKLIGLLTSTSREDPSRSGAASGDASSRPGAIAIEQAEIPSRAVIKNECESDIGGASLPSKRRRRPYQHEDYLDIIEVVDITASPRPGKRREKTVPQSSIVKHQGTNSRRAPAAQATRRWDYRGLVGYELRNGKPWVRVAWHPTWEPAEEFPSAQVEEARHLPLKKGEGGPKSANRLRKARKQQ